MGAYNSKPVVDKHSTDLQNDKVKVGASDMQGWRASQEDAHNTILDYESDSCYFAVYDGHGGHEVAKYTAKYLPEFIKNHKLYKEGKYEQALIDSFVAFDETLITREVVAELKAIASEGLVNDDDDDEDEEDVDHLYREATMPIEEVISKYEDDEAKESLGKKLATKKLGESSKVTPSPFLKGKRESKLNENGDNGKENDEEKPTESKNGVHPVKTVPEVNKKNGEEKNEEQKEDLKDEVKEEKKEEEQVNGHANGEEEEKTVKEEEKEVKEEEEKEAKGKGKGKGKGKSNLIKKTRTPEEEKELEEQTTKAEPLKKKPIKSAEELYKALVEEEVMDEESEEEDDDDQDFEGKVESSDDDDEDADEVVPDGDEVDTESDTEDEAEEQEGCEFIGGNFNEEPGNDSGCTAVVALLKGNHLYVANAGDSRCVVSRSGKAIEMSFDHKPEDEPEMERIHKAGGKVTPDGRVNGGLNLSRAIGDHAYKTNKDLPLSEQMISPVPDIKELQIDPSTDDFMILACDGIWNSLSSQEVVDFVSKKLQENKDKTDVKVSSICEQLFDHCLAPNTMGDGTGCDNMTAVLVLFNSASSKRPAEEETQNPAKKICTE